MEHFLPLTATALALGALHTIAPDHLAAVSVFASKHPTWRRAAGVGARWGFGHSLSVLLLGVVLVYTGARGPDEIQPAIERLVGATLILLGASAMWRSLRPAWRWHEHDGVRHTHPAAAVQTSVAAKAPGGHHARDHRAMMGIGMLHGLAGSGALIATIPIATAASPAQGLWYLTSFGAGTIAAMSTFAVLAGWFVRRASRRSAAVARAAVALAGAASVCVGVWWLLAGGA
jgi:sulfite exporter TauE/SafE